MATGDDAHRMVHWGAGEVTFAGDRYTTIAGSTYQAAPVGIGGFLAEGLRYIIFWEQGGNESLFQTKLESDYTHDSSRKVIIAEATVSSGVDFAAEEKVQIDYKEVAGVQQKLNSSSFNDTLTLKARGGTIANPAYSFGTDTDTGMYNNTTYGDLLGFAVGGAGFSVQERLASNGTYYLSLYPNGAHDGTSGDPFFNIGSYVSEPAGTAWQANPINTINSSYYYVAINGSVTAPAISRWNDFNTGIYFPGTDGIGLTAGGIGILSIWAAAGTPNTGGAYPPTNNLYDIGHSSYKWKDAYVQCSTTTAGTDLIVTAGGLIAKKSSSIQYKDNVKTLEFDASKLNDLRPVSYNYKFENAPDIGLVAEEVHEILPELINYNEKGAPESVKYHSLTVMLLDEVKKLKSELKVLKEKD